MPKPKLMITSMAQSARSVLNGNGATLMPIEKLKRDPKQPRKRFNQKKLQSLSDSIKAQGVLQPIGWYPEPDNDGLYIIKFGERRWLASQMAGLSEIPGNPVLQKSRLVQLIENEQREGLTCMEAAWGIRDAMEEEKLTVAQVCEQTGFSKSYVSKLLTLVDAPDFIQDLEENGITESAENLYTLTVLWKEHPEEVRSWCEAIQEGSTIIRRDIEAFKVTLRGGPIVKQVQAVENAMPPKPELADVVNNAAEQSPVQKIETEAGIHSSNLDQESGGQTTAGNEKAPINTGGGSEQGEEMANSPRSIEKPLHKSFEAQRIQVLLADGQIGHLVLPAQVEIHLGNGARVMVPFTYLAEVSLT
ncbi:hypothetical protein CEK28_08880 [Xenophilus sp. AP218F]|nr:hypothetical protein CEK28_08880 [Xenophilus sp. AP218F]